MGKKDNDTRGLADVELYFNQIRTLLKRYRCGGRRFQLSMSCLAWHPRLKAQLALHVDSFNRL